MGLRRTSAATKTCATTCVQAMDHVKGVQVDLDTKLATVEVEAPNLIDAMNMLPSFVKAIKVGANRRLHRLDRANTQQGTSAVSCAPAANSRPARSAHMTCSCVPPPLACALRSAVCCCLPACPPASVHCCPAHRSLGLRRSHTLSTRPDTSKSDDGGNRVRSCVGRTAKGCRRW